MTEQEDGVYRDAIARQEGKSDSHVLRDMAAQAAVRQFQVDALIARVTRLEAEQIPKIKEELAFYRQLYQRGRGALWMLTAVFGLGIAVVWSRDKIAEILAWISQALGPRG